jgi:hypothetical protein
MLQSAHGATVDPVFLFMSENSCFQSSGFVNAHNNRHWDTENPHTVPKSHCMAKKWAYVPRLVVRE